MSEPLPEREAGDDRHVDIEPGPVASRPRWVTPLGIAVALVAVAALVVLHLTGVIGGGAH
jgi:hypothetical protein